MRALMMLLVFLVGCISMEPVIERKHDSYTGISTINYTAKFSPDRLQVLSVRLVGGKVRMISLGASLNRWRFYDTVYILAGDNQIKLKSFSTRRNVYGRSVFESVVFVMDEKQFTSIVSSSSLRMRFEGKNGRDECVFNTEEMAKLREYKSLVIR